MPHHNFIGCGVTAGVQKEKKGTKTITEREKKGAETTLIKLLWNMWQFG